MLRIFWTTPIFRNNHPSTKPKMNYFYGFPLFITISSSYLYNRFDLCIIFSFNWIGLKSLLSTTSQSKRPFTWRFPYHKRVALTLTTKSDKFVAFQVADFLMFAFIFAVRHVDILLIKKRSLIFIINIAKFFFANWMLPARPRPLQGREL